MTGESFLMHMNVQKMTFLNGGRIPHGLSLTMSKVLAKWHSTQAERRLASKFNHTSHTSPSPTNLFGEVVRVSNIGHLVEPEPTTLIKGRHWRPASCWNRQITFLPTNCFNIIESLTALCCRICYFLIFNETLFLMKIFDQVLQPTDINQTEIHTRRLCSSLQV